MAHGKEGDGQARAKEKDEIGGQLVPEPEMEFEDQRLIIITKRE